MKSLQRAEVQTFTRVAHGQSIPSCGTLSSSSCFSPSSPNSHIVVNMACISNISNPSLEPTSCPISTISEDILWVIFMINAEDSVAHLPLDTTRNCSQVCRTWRHSLVGTSFIWGKLMDWCSLNQETSDEWRNEVLRRSGTSLLWINHPPWSGYILFKFSRLVCASKERASQKCVNFSTSCFFDKLITKNWERIDGLLYQGTSLKVYRLR